MYLSLISTLNFSVHEAAARLVVAPWWTCMQQHTELIWSKSRCDHMRSLCSRFCGGGGWVWSSGRCEVRTPQNLQHPINQRENLRKEARPHFLKTLQVFSPHLFCFSFNFHVGRVRVRSTSQNFCTRCKKSHGCSKVCTHHLHPHHQAGWVQTSITGDNTSGGRVQRFL